MPAAPWRDVAGRALAALIDWGLRVRYQAEACGLENFSRSPSTLIVFNHRRDADTPIIGNILFGRRGLLVREPLPCFIAREDMFRRGFLAHYLAGWPSPVRGLLSTIDLRPVFWVLKAYPMRRIAERTLDEVLEDVRRVFGDLPLDQVLKPEWVERFERLAGEGDRPLRLGQVTGRRFTSLLRQAYGPTRLTRGCFQALKPHERAAIEGQLQLFVDLLERGETLFLAPEGAISRDGRFNRVRGALHVLLDRPRVQVRVLPVGITYDFMTCGRQRVFVNVGREMVDLRGLRPGEASARVSEAILAQSTITASQLASQLLLAARSRGGGIVSRSQLVEHVAEEAARWAKAGLHVDPRLLASDGIERRMNDYVEYCLRFGEMVARGGAHYWVPASAGRGTGDPSAPEGALGYTNNELFSLSCVARDPGLRS